MRVIVNFAKTYIQGHLNSNNGCEGDYLKLVGVVSFALIYFLCNVSSKISFSFEMNGETDEIDSSFQNGVLVFYEIVHGVLWFEENHR